ncbi:N-acetylmuramoyl-L-alanine amidase [Cytobacillus spartinae]
MKIMLDAGHGYNTPGKRSPDGFREYEFNREVACFIRDMLGDFENVTVYFAHSDKRDVPLVERTDYANQLQVDCYVSIHANAHGSGGWSTANGIETFVHCSRPTEALELAENVQRRLIENTKLKNRGVKAADFHVLRKTNMTAVLVECGFMTNKEEVKLLRSDEFQKTCANAIVQALEKQYGLQRDAKVHFSDLTI